MNLCSQDILGKTSGKNVLKMTHVMSDLVSGIASPFDTVIFNPWSSYCGMSTKSIGQRKCLHFPRYVPDGLDKT